MSRTLTAHLIYNLLMAAEVDGDRAPDARRILSAERQSLGLAMERARAAAGAVTRAHAIEYAAEREPAVRAAEHARTEATHRMMAVAAEAQRVAAMWGVEMGVEVGS